MNAPRGGRPRRSGNSQRQGRPQRGQGGGRPREAASGDRLVVGLHPVREVLRAGGKVHRIRVSDARSDSPVLAEILDLAKERGIRVEQVDRDVLAEQAGTTTHQGIVAVAPPFRYAGIRDVLTSAGRDGRPPLLVALDGLTDPHNVGSIARTAEAIGADALLIPSHRAATVTASVEKAAAGALAHLPVVQGNLTQLLELARAAGVWVVGLDADGAGSIEDCALLEEPVVLVVGSEGDGLSRLVTDRCDAVVRLPMRGRVGSLNASVAAAVALYAAERRRSA